MKTETTRIKIAIADDHPIVRRGLAQIVADTENMEVIGEASNGNELLTLVRENKVDIALVDISMPEKSGWDAMNHLKKEFPHLPVIILSVSPEDEYAVQFFRAGASGYLNKTSAPTDLVKAINIVFQGGLFISPQMAQKLALTITNVSNKPPHELLSPREFQILCLIASGKTVKAIAAELSLSPTTVSTHRAHILQKMKLRTNAELTHYAFKTKLLE